MLEAVLEKLDLLEATDLFISFPNLSFKDKAGYLKPLRQINNDEYIQLMNEINHEFKEQDDVKNFSTVIKEMRLNDHIRKFLIIRVFSRDRYHFVFRFYPTGVQSKF